MARKKTQRPAKPACLEGKWTFGPDVPTDDFFEHQNLEDHGDLGEVLAGAGLKDAWALLRGTGEGFTCCHAANLSNAVQQFTKRIDYVFVRDGRERRAVTGVIRRIGDSATDRFAGPVHQLWPSDHTGLVARLDTHQPKP